MLRVLPKTKRKRLAWWPGVTLGDNLLAFTVFMAGLLLSGAVIMGELYPFGISYLAAVCIYEKHLRKAALLGVAAGSFLAVEGSVLVSYLAGYVLIFLILCRYQKKENHWLILPVLVLAINLLTRGFPILSVENGLYRWVGVIFESIFSGVLCLVCITGLHALPKLKRGYMLNPEERTSLGIILLGSIIGVGRYSFFQLSMQSVLSRCLVLTGGYLAGPGGGTAVGVAVGLIPSIQGNLATGPIAFYGLAGLLSGIFNSFGKTGVVVGFTLSNLLLTLFFAEKTVIVQSFWESGTAIILFSLVPLAGLQLRLRQGRQHVPDAKEINKLITERLLKISTVLSEIEKTFRVGPEARQETKEISDFSSQIAAQVCEGCGLYKVCWEQDFYKTYRALIEAGSKLEKAGTISERDFNRDLQRRCRRLRELGLIINSQWELFKMRAGFRQQLNNASGLLVRQVKGLAQIIQNLAQELKIEVMPDQELAQYLQEWLKEKGILVRRIDISPRADGENEFIISQDQCVEENWCKAMVAPNISQILGKTYAVRNLDCRGQGCCSFVLEPSPMFKVIVGKAQCPKEGEEVSGDVCAAVDMQDHRTLLMMSDGMGAGEEALQESKAALRLLESMLLAGFTLDTVLKTVNTALFLRTGQEKFATLDIVIINRVNGQADFIKLGGAPSLLCSEKGIRIVKGATPPAGILEEIEINHVHKKLSPGSILIMMSDGVWEAVYNAGGPIAWLEEVLTDQEYSNPHKLAGYLLYLAKKATGNKAKDDMCIQVAYLNGA